jgi:phosphinothricin acetyltransferase
MDVKFKTLQADRLEEAKAIFDHYTMRSTANLLLEVMSLREFQQLLPLHHPLYPAIQIENEEARLVGFGALRPFQHAPAFRRSAEAIIYLKENYCNRGFGRITLLQLEQQARKNGIINLLATVTGNAPAAYRLLEHNGYIQIAWYRNIGEKFGLLHDQVVFQKAI